MKKFVSLVLCVLMVIGLVACGSDKNTASTAPGGDKNTDGAKETVSADGTAASSQTEGGAQAGAIDFDEEPYTLNVCYAVMGEAQPDLPLIEEKLNEITLREINAKVHLEAVSLFSMANVYALKASSQEKMDLLLLFPGSSYLTNFANSNLLMPVEDYVDQWGKDIVDCLGDMMAAGQYKGHQYAIPQNRDVRKNANGFNLSKELCAKYDINPEEIKTLEDLEAVFALIKEKEPGVTVLMPETSGQGIASILADYYDTCGIGGGILQVESDGSLKIVDQTQTASYINACKKVHEWYEKGYISKDVLTTQDSGTTLLPAGKCFASATMSINANMGHDFAKAVVINNEKPLLTTTEDQMILWGVGSSCERPDKAIQFLNMCYASEEVTNLMMFGVENTHYIKQENGTIDTANYENWQAFWPMFGDYNKQYVIGGYLDVMGVDSVDEYKTRMASWPIEMSPAYGFTFDPTNVKTQIAACDAVNNEYMLAITCGTVDPETELPKWSQKLEDAGLNDVMAEKQKQLDEWLASKN